MSAENKNIQSINAEQVVLATLIGVAGSYDRVSGTLTEQDFAANRHGLIYRAIASLASHNQPYDVVMVQDWLGRNNLLNEEGCPLSYLAQLLSQTPALAFNLEHYASLVRSKSDRRKSIDIHRSAILRLEQGAEDTADVSNEVLDELTSVLTGSQEPSYQSMKSMISDMCDRLERCGKEGAPFIKTGFIELDNKLLMTNGDLVVVAARPSMGKTALVMNWLTNIAKTYDGTAVFFSLEMRAEQVMDRMTSAEAGVRLDAMRSGSLTEDDWARILKFTTDYKDLPLVVVEKPEITIGQIRTELNRIQREQRRNGIADGRITAIAVDYLQIMGGLDGNDRINKIGTVTRTLKALGKEYNCPVILLSQLSRDVEKRPNKRPISSDLRDSGTIEQDADIVAMIYRDDYYKSKEIADNGALKNPPDGMAEIILTKNRNGATGAVGLGFEGQYSRFVEGKPMFEINIDDFYKADNYAGAGA